jgi:hypothetical protein
MRWAPRVPRPIKCVVKLLLGRYRLVEGPLTYNQDALATRLNCDFLKDPRFMRAYEAGLATGSWGQPVHWRVHVACWAAERGMGLEGDFVECGVNKGGLSRAVMEYVDFRKSDRRFYLLDTFCGLREDHMTDEEKQIGVGADIYEECYDAVRRTFAEFPQVDIIRGPVPETLPQVKARKVAYLSIDMNCVQPEIAAAEFFWDKLSSGAVIVFDDYGWPGCSTQRVGADAFAARKGVGILSLPTGQAIIIKP